MAGTKKYAGLPDLDDAGTELYQTPALTDDASTIQTSTLRTDSPTPSEEANENLDHTRFDREGARRRFEPAVIDATDVNFSYAVGGNQKSYTSRQRRRRRLRRSNGAEEYGDLSDGSDIVEEETLGQRLARLKREAEQVRLEIERREKEDDEFQDSFEDQQGGTTDHEDNATNLTKDMDDLSKLLNSLRSSTRHGNGSLEEEFTRRLDADNLKSKVQATSKSDPSIEKASNSTINAITSFSDRLSAIESALGLSTISPASNPIAILPTLETLSNQINLLNSTISPGQTALPSANSNTNLTPQMPHLDILQSRLHTLHQFATSLLSTRKAAQTALSDLETVRLRGIRAADHLARYQNLANRRANRSSGSHHPGTEEDKNLATSGRPTSHGGAGTTATIHRDTVTGEARERVEIADEIVTPLFLEEQAEKIKALYNVLPTIQDLQPLLPIVLERLRGLSVVHAGAADARGEMDELEARLREWEGELAKWRGAVEGAEGGIEEMKGVMKENVEHVGGLVRGVEDRVGNLERGK